MHKQLLIIVITIFCGSIVASSTLSGSLTNMKPFGKHRYKTDCAYYAARLEPHEAQSSVAHTKNHTNQQSILRDLAAPQHQSTYRAHDDNYAAWYWLFLILKISLIKRQSYYQDDETKKPAGNSFPAGF